MEVEVVMAQVMAVKAAARMAAAGKVSE
jgi:hypothetical protein